MSRKVVGRSRPSIDLPRDHRPLELTEAFRQPPGDRTENAPTRQWRRRGREASLLRRLLFLATAGPRSALACPVPVHDSRASVNLDDCTENAPTGAGLRRRSRQRGRGRNSFSSDCRPAISLSVSTTRQRSCGTSSAHGDCNCEISLLWPRSKRADRRGCVRRKAPRVRGVGGCRTARAGRVPFGRDSGSTYTGTRREARPFDHGNKLGAPLGGALPCL